MNSALKWSLFATVGLALASAALFVGRDGRAPAGETVLKYKHVTAERGPFRLAVSANGIVRPIDRIELKSKASGKVIALPIEVGDAIEQGALVAKLDQVEERTALAQARADLQIARAELVVAEKSHDRRKELFERKVVSEENLDQTGLSLAQARGQLVRANTSLERAQERMEDSVITAPVHGIILQKYVEKGQIIASGVSNVGGGTPIADIADMRDVHVEAGIDEIDIGRLQVGQGATVRAEAYPEQVYRGEVVRIAPEARVEQNVTLFDVVIRVANTDGKLKSGMNATVEVVIVERNDVLAIPVAALRADGESAHEGASVLVQEGGSYVPRAVTPGISNYRVVEILDGLEAGDVLAIPMVSRLKDDNDMLDARIRRSRSFGGGSGGGRRPKEPRG